eukprot:jgi/Chlat1/1491/Chrsp12S02026
MASYDGDEHREDDGQHHDDDHNIGGAEHDDPRDDYSQDMAGKRRSDESSQYVGENVYRLLISTKRVGAIIGKGGTNIKAICSDTGARVKILDPVSIDDPERVVLVSGRDDASVDLAPAQQALLRAHQCVLDGQTMDENTAPDSKLTTRMLVPTSQAGSLIGKGGATVKAIQEETGVTMRVLTEQENPRGAVADDRVLEMHGNPVQLQAAVKAVSAQVRKFLVDRSVLPLYEAAKLQPSYGSSYAASPGPSYSQGYQPASYQQAAYMPAQQPSYAPPSSKFSQFQSVQAPAPVVATSTLQMRVPAPYLAAVVGANSSSINQIRQISGAQVTAYESADGISESVVEITGTSAQVQAAQALVQAFMLNANAATAAAPAPTNYYGQPQMGMQSQQQGYGNPQQTQYQPGYGSYSTYATG